MFVYAQGVCSSWLLKPALSTKGCVPTLLYDGQVQGPAGTSGPCRGGKYMPVSNKAAALLPLWRHPGSTAPTLPCFMTVGQVVAVLSVAGRGLVVVAWTMHAWGWSVRDLLIE